jgi:hypothetical protein
MAEALHYDKKTSPGVRMSYIASARPQRLNIFQSSSLFLGR